MIKQNHECYVSLEVAKLLKDAGFDWPCNHAICCDSTHYPNIKESDVLEYNYLECSELMEGKKPHMLLCPTLAVAQRWLREIKLYNVLVDTGGYKNYEYFIDYHGVKEGPNYPFHEYNHNLICSTYEQALEVGIKKALEMILEEGE